MAKRTVPDDARCQWWTDRGRCARRWTCGNYQKGWRYCTQHARVAEPRSFFWM